MIKNKKVLAVSLALTIATMPVLAGAKDIDIKEVKESVNVEQISEEVTGQYMNFPGEIKTINKTKDGASILIENKDNKENQLIGHINKDVKIYNNKTQELIKVEDLKAGQNIEMFYSSVTPVALSLPGQLTPEIIVVKESDVNAKVDLFNNDLVSSDNVLKLNIDKENTKIVDTKGNKVDESQLKGSKLLVFFGATTRSIPAQTAPEKIIVLEKFEDMKLVNFDIVTINNKTVELDGKIYTNKDGVVMVPLRQITEDLGYTLTWNAKDYSTELTRGAEWTRVKIGENNYSFAKMAFELEAAPELKDGKTYVPVSFLTRALALDTVFVGVNGSLYLK